MRIINSIKQRLLSSVIFIPALKLVWKASPYWTVTRTVLVICQGLLPLLSIYLTKLIIDTVTASLNNTEPTEALIEILPLLVMAAGTTITMTLCLSLAELVNTAHSQKVTDYMQEIIHAKSVEVDLEYYENAKYHDALQRAQQEASFRPTQILNRLVGVCQGGISLIAMIGLLITLHWGIIGVLLVASIPAMLARVQHSRLMYAWQRKTTENQRKSRYLGLMLTGEAFAKEIRLFNLGSLFRRDFLSIRSQLYEDKLAILIKRFLTYFLAQTFAGILIFTVFVYIIDRALRGILSLGDLVLYYQALQKGQSSLNLLLKNLSGLYEDNLYLANLYEFLNLAPQIKSPDKYQIFPVPLKQGIRFEKVSFSYSNSTRQALKNIDLEVKPGETIALVGENGSGKTTLIKLLCRLYDPSSGKITVDGVNLCSYKIDTLRSQIAVIFQDYAKYYFTAEENIRLGNIEVVRGDERIVDAARRSGADKVINQLSRGYNTNLGRVFDGGEELSIGQWQKVALARAFLRDSQVIVLDEPTSAMDPKSEYEVFKKFRELIEDRAAILITHRLSTVRMADRIYVMDRGKIVENGTHEQLIRSNSLYARLYNIQSQNYH